MKLQTLEVNIHDCKDYERLYWSKELIINSNIKVQKAFFYYFHGIENDKLKEAISLLKKNKSIEINILEISYNRRKVLAKILEESETYYIVQKEYSSESDAINKNKDNIRAFVQKTYPYIIKNKFVHIFNYSSNTYKNTGLSKNSFLSSLDKIEKAIDFFEKTKKELESLL